VAQQHHTAIAHSRTGDMSFLQLHYGFYKKP